MRKEGLERRLESLLWGYPELIVEFKRRFLLALPSAKLLDDQLIMRGCRRLSKGRVADDEIAEVWQGTQGKRMVALKVLHSPGEIASGKKVLEVSHLWDSKSVHFNHTRGRFCAKKLSNGEIFVMTMFCPFWA